MLRLLLIVVLSSATMLAQSQPAKAKAQASGAAKPQTPASATPAAPSPKPAATPAQEASAQVAANQPVITLHGLCANMTDGLAKPAAGAEAKAPCTSTVSKQDFEKLVKALPINQPLTPALRRRLAQQYAELLAVAQAAAKAGVDKDPNLEEMARFQRMQNLAQLYIRSLEEKYKSSPQSEIDAYYKEHQAQYEEVTLQRVYVPKTDPAAKNATPDQKSAWEAKAQGVATDLKDRASKGEDMSTLQKEGYTKLGITTNPPNIDIGGVRKGALPAETDKALFALTAGGVYQSNDPTAFVIYKVVKKQTLAADAVKDEISRALYQQKMEASKKEAMDSVKADFNDEYFGAAPSAAPPGAAR